jgi:hypothetical protein
VCDVAAGTSLAIFSHRAAGGLYGGSFSPNDEFIVVASENGSQVYACDVCAPIPEGNPLGAWPPIFDRTTG